ncbi:unnamed protein product [Oncorhynchus mykiss]|uniref:EGF-like domain-containing protein n=1 Tax=Oncorhynchus mykiss TaxID=8022 RepID=A0A060Z2P9_ONCMY|nr:unnamed protein product [Oncorhynchus mykiss]
MSLSPLSIFLSVSLSLSLSLCLCIYLFLSLPVDCLDPTCSGRGVCVRGECHCFVGWGGSGCESTRASCMDQCSGHGAFLTDTGTCSCDPNWTGQDCSTGQWLKKYILISQSNTHGVYQLLGTRYDYRVHIPTFCRQNSLSIRQVMDTVSKPFHSDAGPC